MKRSPLRRVGAKGKARAAAMRAIPIVRDYCPRCRLYGRLERHHKLPRSLGGTDTLRNIAYLCALCHREVHEHKGDWRKWMKGSKPNA